ncbi:MAG: DUF917 domain-containing protein [Proteobacteria bacterium]|nr:DUF917 domain-containing protein [Pseudomonadota bacterium]
MNIDLDNLDDLALGTAFLSTGGGGDPYLYQLALHAAIAEKGPVTLIKPEDLDDEATIMSLGGVGAPLIGSEKLPNGLEGAYAIRKLEEFANVKADALIAAEIGGGNGLVPLLAALHTGLPVVDADGMGRAYPETQMETFSIYGISATPMSAVDEFGNSAIITAGDSITAERIVRQIGLAMGGQCMAADHIMSGIDVKKYGIRNTVSLSTELGKVVRRSRDIAELLAASCPLLVGAGYGAPVNLFEGKVVDVHREMVGGYDVGEFVISSFDGQDQMTINVQNEYLIAIVDGQCVATVPDLICVIDCDTLLPITSERLRYGLRIGVIGVPAPALYKSPEALAVTNPRAFGFDIDYTEMVVR